MWSQHELRSREKSSSCHCSSSTVSSFPWSSSDRFGTKTATRPAMWTSCPQLETTRHRDVTLDDLAAARIHLCRERIEAISSRAASEGMQRREKKLPFWGQNWTHVCQGVRSISLKRQASWIKPLAFVGFGCFILRNYGRMFKRKEGGCVGRLTTPGQRTTFSLPFSLRWNLRLCNAHTHHFICQGKLMKCDSQLLLFSIQIDPALQLSPPVPTTRGGTA